MTDNTAACWQPRAEHLVQSGVARLQQHFGLPDYDALLRHALDEPEHYWREVAAFCEFPWDTPPAAYVDLGRGREFPHWPLPSSCMHGRLLERGQMAGSSDPEAGSSSDAPSERLAS